MIEPYYDHDGIQIWHADCREVLPLLGPVDLVLTDPPYGDDHDTDYTRFTGGITAPRNTYAAVAGDADDFDPSPLLTYRQVMLCGANRYSDKLPTGSWLVWDKRTPFGSKGVMSDAEVIWWSRGRGVYIWQHTWDGFNRQSERRSNLHPTQKPVALFRWCLSKARLAPGSLVVDPYMGSGSALQAAKEMGFRAVGCDIELEYCEIAAQRLSQEVMQL